MTILIHTEDLHKSYLMGLHAVAAPRGIDLEIQDGEFLAIMGPSGSGKAALLHLIGGLDTPSRGSIFFEKMNLALLSSNQLAEFRLRKVGFIFQTFHLVPTITIILWLAIGITLFAVFANTQTAVLESRPQIGIFKAIGLKDGQIR